MTKTQIKNKTDFKIPLWGSIFIWGYFIINIILEPIKILPYAIATLIMFFCVGKIYSFAKRLDKKGIVAIWLGILFGPIALIFYYLYYLKRIKY